MKMLRRKGRNRFVGPARDIDKSMWLYVDSAQLIVLGGFVKVQKTVSHFSECVNLMQTSSSLVFSRYTGGAR